MSAASQLMKAYTMYADDNDGRLLRGVGGTAFDANGNQIDDKDFIDVSSRRLASVDDLAPISHERSGGHD